MMMLKRAMAIGLAAVFGVTGAVQAGLQFTAVTETREAGSRRVERATVKGLADGERVRIEFIEGHNPMTQPGTYMISRDGGRTVYLVNPAERSYMEMDMEKLAGAAGDMMGALGGMVSIDVRDHTVETLHDGTGPQMLGYPTRHVKLKSSYTLATRVMGMSQTQKQVREDEIWSTDKIDLQGLMAWADMQAMRTGHESLDKLIAAEMDAVKGFPLKRVTRQQTEQRGRVQEATTTFEVTEIGSARPAADAFTVPEGYERVSLEMPDLEQLRGAGAEEREQPAASDEEPGAVESLMRMFRGRR